MKLYGNVKQLHGIRVGPPPKFEAIAGTEFVMDADLILLAMGFAGPVRNGLIDQLGVKLDQRGNIETGTDYMSSVAGVFMQKVAFSAPLLLGGGLKIIYDLLLYRSFRHVAAPEEK